MGLFDRARDALSGSDNDKSDDTAAEPLDGEVSSAGSSFGDETATGGADAVPDTPDGVPEDYT